MPHKPRKLLPEGNSFSDIIFSYFPSLLDRGQITFERLCDGNFNDGGFFEVERPNDVTVLSCILSYRIDTKGFYQPVYLFELSSEDGSYKDWIMIPAMK